MRIVNEAHRVRQIVLRKRKDDDPRNPVEREKVVEFDERGVAQVGDDLGAELVASEKYPTIREAEGPDDVAEGWLEEADPWDRTDATDAAREAAREAGLEPSDVEGTGKDGRVLVDDVEAALEDDDEG